MQNFEQVRRHVATNGFNAFVNEAFVVGVELSHDGGRRHESILLSELQDDDHRCYLRLSTAVGPITGIAAPRALAHNWNSRVG